MTGRPQLFRIVWHEHSDGSFPASGPTVGYGVVWPDGAVTVRRSCNRVLTATFENLRDAEHCAGAGEVFVFGEAEQPL